MAELHDADIFVPHAFAEQSVDLGEVRMNYATAGAPGAPPLLLVPPQTQSWWTYEAAMGLLAEDFHVFAVDLRGQGRSTRTPGRYTLDNMGNDLVRFLDLVVERPALVSGNSSGGLLAAWLAAYAKPGQVRGVVCEDPPFFAAEVSPACGQSIRQAIGPLFALASKWLGDQWTIGDWNGMQAAAPREMPQPVLVALVEMGILGPPGGEPPQNMREYDPEWARAFWSGAASASCDHERMLSAARVPMLLTHHFRTVDPDTGTLMGAVSDLQVKRAGQLVEGAGQRFEVRDLPQMAHSMHAHDPEQFARIVTEWARSLVAEGTPA